MELYQLRSFSMVAKLGQLTKAAERLHVSQPALSGQIKALESLLELKLFERAPSGMVLTAAGKQLLPRALEALACGTPVLALGEGGEARAPMAVCVIGGLITSTLLTLVVVPVVYTFMERITHSGPLRWVGRKLMGESSAPREEHHSHELESRPAPGE